MPNINFQASAYYEMIDWKGDYTEPPLTKRIGYDDTAAYIQTGEGDLPKLTSVILLATCLTNIPCHSQAVERLVKLGQKQQHWYLVVPMEME